MQYCIHAYTTHVDITDIDYVIDRSRVVEYSRERFCTACSLLFVLVVTVCISVHYKYHITTYMLAYLEIKIILYSLSIILMSNRLGRLFVGEVSIELGRLSDISKISMRFFKE